MKLMNKLLLAVSSLGLAGISVSAEATLPQSSENKFVKSSPSKNSVNSVAASIKRFADGKPTPANVKLAIEKTLSQNKGANLSTVAAALNSLNLKGDALKNALNSVSTHFNVPTTQVASAMITESYMNDGKVITEGRVAEMKAAVGDETVQQAMNRSPMGNNLGDIQPAAGGDDGAGSSVYHG